MGGSTESFRSNEFQLEQLSFGGDIRIQNVRGRFLTMFGEFATTTPRNDASYSRGQWDLADAYRYVSEAWGGYHWDKLHGVNLDAGIFVSYIGLFSYYNADNWTYQPSYVSSNTPWFFTGVRGQVFLTKNLKIEPWFINGWQTYARYNGKPGLGGQILWRPKPWLDLVFNNYGLGEDAYGVPYRHRYHTDDSIQVKYYDNKSHFIDKAAFTFTADAGCEVGVGTNPVDAGTNVACHGDKPAPASAGGGTAYKQYFIGYMVYNRVWWDKDKYAFHPGRRSNEQSRPLLDLVAADQRRNGDQRNALLHRESWRSLHGLRYDGNAGLHAEPIHHLPHGGRLSARECSLLDRPWRHYASGWKQRISRGLRLQ